MRCAGLLSHTFMAAQALMQRVAMARPLSLKALFKETPVTQPNALEVKLSPEEDRLCTLLDECKRHLDSKGKHVECRIAGGWVRDKLLGAESHDIDIALASMMGVEFAENLTSFLESKNIPTRSVHKIERNPEQSKHLETAHTKVLGFEVDFVNLRSEQYAGDSRIPTEIKLGTPMEDALRRDVTFNAMFYNVHTRSVEDFTSKGLDDLRNGVLRTPLPPKETFLDDPLRVLRCIRFASRYGFKLVPEIEEAAKDAEIKAAIVNKVSKERVGEELDKMMRGRDPLHSIRLIDSLQLQSSIFALPTSVTSTLSSDTIPYSSTLGACTILHALLASPSSLGLPDLHPYLLSQLPIDNTLRPRLFFAAALTPFRHITYRTHKGEERPTVEAVIREALKRGQQNHYSDGIPALFAGAEALSNPAVDRFSGENERSKLGLFLRTKSVHQAKAGSHWSSSLLFSLVQQLVPLWQSQEDTFDVAAAATIVNTYNNFVKRVDELGLIVSIDEKPIFNGKEVISILSAPKSGPWLGGVLSKIEAWQLDHPGAGRDECEEWLLSEKAAGHVQFVEKTKGEGLEQAPSKKIKTV